MSDQPPPLPPGPPGPPELPELPELPGLPGLPGPPERSEPEPPPPLPRPDADLPRTGPAWTLALQPGRFVAARAPRLGPAAAALLAWTVGVQVTAEALALVLAAGRGSSVHVDWRLYGVALAAGGLALGPLAWAAGGALLRVRLLAAGGVRREHARRAWLIAAAVQSVTVVLLLGRDAARSARPCDASLVDDTWSLLALLVAAPWSVALAWRGARRLFGVEPVRAVLLLFALPMGCKATVLLAALLIAGARPARVPPDLRRPEAHEGGTLTFRYPGNWSLDVDEEWRQRIAHVAAPQDAIVSLAAYASERSLGEELDLSLQELSEAGFAPDGGRTRPVASWGPVAGAGLAWTSAGEAGSYEVEVVVGQAAPGWVAEVRTIALAAQERLVAPGFALVRDTLVVSAPRDEPPDVDHALDFRFGFLSLRHPGNWEVTTHALSDPRRPWINVRVPQDARVEILVYDRNLGLEEELDATVEGFRSWGEPEVVGRFESWAGLDGRGREVTFHDEEGGDLLLWIFVTHLTGARTLEVRLGCEPGQAEALRAGLAFVERHFHVAP